MDRIEKIKQDMEKIYERIASIEDVQETKTKSVIQNHPDLFEQHITNYPQTNGWDALYKTAYVLSFAGIFITELVLHLAFWWIVPSVLVMFAVGALIWDI
jgi:hypothetical protein